MVERDQVKPLAPASSGGLSSDEEDSATNQKKSIRRRRCIKCCGCLTVLFVLIITVIIILVFTVLKVKEPSIKMNGVTIDRLELVPGSNLTVTADISVKNPNHASFRYSNTTTSLYYHGTVVGEARGPPGKAESRRTVKMNVTVDIITDRLLSNPSLSSDMSSGLITMNSFTKVGGKVKILGFVKRHVSVRMNCTMTINTTSQAIQEQKCKRKVKL